MDLITILSGLAAGATYGLSTFAKKENQVFDWKKFGTTLIIGGGAGAGAAIMNLPIDMSYVYLVQLGAIPVVENGFKIIHRKIIKWFIKKKPY